MKKTDNEQTNRKRMSAGEKILAAFVVLALIVAGYALFTAFKTIFPGEHDAENGADKESHLSFTSFDTQLAKKLMDSDGDGKCDACGMPVGMCIESGQMECTMTGKAGMGILGSDHIHANWKIFINGKPFDFTGYDHMGRMGRGEGVSSFIHVDEGAPPPEKVGDVLHMHATNIPLWVFFESVGMKLSKDCFVIDNSQYCNDDAHSLKFLVNGLPSDVFEQYIFHDDEKILISYGPVDDPAISDQLASITDFAGRH